MALTEEQNQSIRAFHAANGNNPQAIAAAQAQYGVSPADYDAAISPTREQVDAGQSEAVRLQQAYEASPDYGNTQSAAYKAYAAARTGNNQTNDAWMQQQYLAQLRAGNLSPWEKSQGMRPGQLLASATGDQSFTQPPPQRDPNDRTVVGGTPTQGLINQVANQGRNGDTEIGHLTPGEVVIPAEVAATQPGLVNGVMSTVRRMGGDPSKLTVGKGNINPVTGIQEFATDTAVADAYGKAAALYTTNLGRGGDHEGINYWASRIADGQDVTADFQASTKSVQDAYAQTGSSPYAALLDKDASKAAAAAAPVSSVIPNGPTGAPVSQAAYDQAASMYTTNLGRAGDQEGINYWAGQIASGKDISEAFKGSAKTVYENYAKTGSNPYSALLDQDFQGAAKGTSPQQSLESPISEYIYGKAAPAAAPVVTAAPSGAAQATQERWNITPQMTVQQQIADITRQDSVLMQQARSAALQQMNARGLVNSSMGIGAGQQAVLNSAMEIGKQDANTYASAGQFNAGQFNDLSKFNTGQTNTWNTNALDREQQTNERLGSQSYNSGEKALDRTFASGESALDRTQQTSERIAAQGYNSGEKAIDRTFNSGENALDRGLTTSQNDANRTFTAGQSALDRSLTTTQNQLSRDATTLENDRNRVFTGGQNDLNRTATSAESAAGRAFTAAENKANRQAEVDRYNFDATTRTTLASLSNTYDGQMQKDSSVANAYNQLTGNMAAIDTDPNLSAEAKTAAKGRLTNQFTAYAKIRGVNMDLVFDAYKEEAATTSGGSTSGTSTGKTSGGSTTTSGTSTDYTGSGA